MMDYPKSDTKVADTNSPTSIPNHRMSISGMLSNNYQSSAASSTFNNKLENLLNEPTPQEEDEDAEEEDGDFEDEDEEYEDGEETKSISNKARTSAPHSNGINKTKINSLINPTSPPPPETPNSLDSSYTKATLEDYENLNAKDLFTNFKQRTKNIVNLDTISITDANKLKFLENEFQTTTYPNGVYVNNKFIDTFKHYLVSKDYKILDKLIKREKSLNHDSSKIQMLKNQQLKFVIDSIRENKLKLNEIEVQNLLQLDNIKNAKLASTQLTNETPAAKRARTMALKKARAEALKNQKIDPNVLDTSFIDIAPKGKRKRRTLNATTTAEAAATSVAVMSTHGGETVIKRRKVTANSDSASAKNGNGSSKGDGNGEASATPVVKRRRRTKSKIAADNAAAAAAAAEAAAAGIVPTKRGKGRSKANKEANDATKASEADGEVAKDDAGREKLPKIKLTLKPKITLKEQRAIDKQYDNTYISIWKDLARKDGPKAYRMFQQSTQAKQINLRKTSLLAARESKRWQIKTNKSQKDLITKARRSMREMMNFWKKNEREERDLRKKAEKEAADVAKKEEEERESRRQARKLNFLITQTELYSHFIGKKIKTDEFEGNMADSAISTGGNDARNAAAATDVDLSHANKDFNSLDFEDGNDDNLTKAAAANAQTALLEAQAKAQAFNQDLPKDANADDENEMNFQNPTSLGEINIEQPKLLNCTLKEYQLKGLNWLANLYDQGINGILADEMGLGKTVQSISVLAYLAETHNIWGPFLVVTPASTLHNWQQEITRFVPDFKVLPYWGTAKDRKVLRKFWDRKSIIYKKESPIHVVVTSYQLVVADAQYFSKMKWQYMILDEAQAIKSSSSSRWKSLLSLQCRNRLLLTGTPIQNSMQELWALLHFIMPSLFDSHDEFSEWFSKDIESHAQSNTELNEQQLRRLHMILKPFMLRRIKKNVQSELGDKIELDIYCDLTNRQKKLYRMLRSQINLMDLIENSKRIGSDENQESLMNVVMQFRKVCNHPDLFERADTKSAFNFSRFAQTGSLMREASENLLEYNYSSRNLIEYKLPKLIFDELLSTGDKFDSLVDTETLIKSKFNIWSPDNIQKESSDSKSFSWLKFVDYSASEVSDIQRKDLLSRAIDSKSYTNKSKMELVNRFHTLYGDEHKSSSNKLFLINNFEIKTNEEHLKELVTVKDKVYYDMYLNVSQPGSFEIASAPPIDISCSLARFNFAKHDSLFDSKIRSAMSDLSLNTQYDLYKSNTDIENYPKAEMMCKPINSVTGFSSIRLPSMKRFVIESGKLAKLDEILVDLKKGGHKCLLYFQMTRMMDLMEEFLKYRQYSYIRLDGSSKLGDRRDLVHDWQTKPELFIFLLSTRAGGLGINLTAADTVIFYDSDWNPTIDSQAMDRAHRLGQTRQVTVYRLLVRGTIEERMRDRAKQKEHVQQVVMEGKASADKTAALATSSGGKENNKDVAMWLLNDDEDDNEEDSTTTTSATVAVTTTAEVVANGGEDKVVEMDNKLQELYHEGEGKFESGTVTPIA